jgi:predicted GIY-YIG superfamily endonuclease
MKFYYVYIIQSDIDQNRFYTGFTEDLDSRLKSHNSGGCDHTSKYRPWRMKTAIASVIDRKPSILKNISRALLAVPLPKKGSEIQRQY